MDIETSRTRSITNNVWSNAQILQDYASPALSPIDKDPQTSTMIPQ